jgi:hypothetical protein
MHRVKYLNQDGYHLVEFVHSPVQSWRFVSDIKAEWCDRSFCASEFYNKHSLRHQIFTLQHLGSNCHLSQKMSISSILTPSDASLIRGDWTTVVAIFLKRLIFVKYCLQTLHFPPVAIFMAHFLQDSKHLQGTGQYSVHTALQTKHALSSTGLFLALPSFSADKLVNIFLSSKMEKE